MYYYYYYYYYLFWVRGSSRGAQLNGHRSIILDVHLHVRSKLPI